MMYGMLCHMRFKTRKAWHLICVILLQVDNKYMYYEASALTILK